MKISLNWLSDYVDVDGLTPEEMAERLTLATAESEGVEIVENAAAVAIVIEVLAVDPLPATGPVARSLVTVATGSGTVKTVSTATNVHVGARLAYAPSGAVLPGGAVGASEVAGHTSVGMLCSASELGLGSNHDIVLECPMDATVGAPLSTWIPSRDALIDFDNKSLTHRPDLWGHYGFAREVAAVLGRKLRPLPVAELSGFDSLPPFPTTDEVLDECPCFTCIAVDIAANVPSPLAIQARLHNLGQRTFNVLVDATNYVALELGQPTHIYDRQHVAQLRVARAGAAVTTFRTLDDQERRLEPEDVLIFGADGPIGLAGIMGGLDSGVRPETTQVLLESANFRAARVRRTAIRMGLRTDASQRYEKGQPPSNAPVGLSRLMRLLDDAGARPQAVSRAMVLGDPTDRPRRISMPASYIQERAGADLPPERSTQILAALGFRAETVGDRLEVEVPPFRSVQDIGLPADILEEVLRVYGFASVTPRLPEGIFTPTAIAQPIRREHKARRLLSQAYGFTEVESYPWYDDDWNAQIGFNPGESLRLLNPVAPQRSRIRTTLMPGLLRNVLDNAANGDEIRLFEIGRVFLPGAWPEGSSASPETHAEEVRVAGVSVAPARGLTVEDHFRRIKGALEDLGVMLAGVQLTTGAGRENGGAPWQVPDLWSEICLRGDAIGTVGVLMGPILDTVAPQRQVIWFEMRLRDLDGPIYPEVDYQALASVPGSRQDFSLVWPERHGYEQLASTLDGFKHPLVVRREFITVYRGKGLGVGLGSYTFRYWLQAEHTLTGVDLERFRNEFLAFVREQNIELR